MKQNPEKYKQMEEKSPNYIKNRIITEKCNKICDIIFEGSKQNRNKKLSQNPEKITKKLIKFMKLYEIRVEPRINFKIELK